MKFFFSNFFFCFGFASRFVLLITFGRHSVSFALLHRRINAVVGLLEIKLSETVVRRQLYQTYSGPLCRVCERRVSCIQSAQQQSCSGCSVGITTEYYGPAHHHPIVVVPRVSTSPETLYYLCFRKSSEAYPITKKTIKALRV